jgi:hypothetical protein
MLQKLNRWLRERTISSKHVKCAWGRVSRDLTVVRAISACAVVHGCRDTTEVLEMGNNVDCGNDSGWGEM